MTAPTLETYNRVARWLHWAIAVMAILNLIGGIFHDAIGDSIPVIPLHKATGVTVLFLTLARIVWRLTHPVPALPAALAAWEGHVARITHALFYILLLIVPLTGWIMSSPGTRPLTWFGLFDLPRFAVTKGDAVVGLSHEGHEILGYAFAALVILHIAAALRHHFILKDAVLRRMLG